MPRHPQWFPHLSTALEALERSSAPVIDRAGVEQLLGVSRRSAIRLLHQFGGFQSGKTFLIAREALQQALLAIQKGEAFEQESVRRQRLDTGLQAARGDLRARQVKLPVVENPLAATTLPAGIYLRPGLLTVEFSSPEQLLGKLYELVQIAAQDFERFETLVKVEK